VVWRGLLGGGRGLVGGACGGQLPTAKKCWEPKNQGDARGRQLMRGLDSSLNCSPPWHIPQFTWMPLVPELVTEELDDCVFHVLIPRDQIVRGSRVIDQVVQSCPFLRAEIKYRGVVSFEMLRFEIVIIFIRKTKSERGNRDREKTGSNRGYCPAN